MSQSTHYTAKDIERYHSGQLSAAEMHALEKAALDDPFLADALEGYSYTKTAETDQSVLQQKLQLRIEKENTKKRLFYIGNNWMKIAALFILFAGGGWLVFQTFSKSNKNDIAATETLDRKSPSVVTTTSPDSATNFSDSPGNGQTLTFKENTPQTQSKTTEVTVNKSS